MTRDVNPFKLPSQSRRTNFEPDEGLMLRLFPSSVCIQTPMQSAVILGREMAQENRQGIDLSRFEARKHGVSRRHAVLRRQDNRLVLADLGSTNGTLLNGERLEPGREYEVANGDHVTLGTLMFAIFFSSRTTLH